MAICKDCIHHSVCYHIEHYGRDMDDDTPCRGFLFAADVKEVRHGEWVYHECVFSHDGAKSGYSCSECSGFVDEEIFDMDEFNKSFCGACGAKMSEKVKRGKSLLFADLDEIIDSVE